ncbi:MAG: c-type cytochrome [Acidobacteria bacterium]|nr:c-type cytochrome [Acidobacteriota bacterium]
MIAAMRFALPLVFMAHALAQLPRDLASIDAGRQTYMGACSGCHGATGEGSQGPSLHSGRVARLGNQALISVIKNGLPGTTMPNFPLADDKLRQLAAFLRTLTSPAIAAPLTGDPAKGRASFFGAAKCTGCHMINGRGGHPGPDLSNIGAERTLPQLRESLAKPSARIAEGFRTARVTLRDGSVIRGVAKNYNNYGAQILDAKGQLHLLQSADMAKLDIADTSMMPPVSDINDLLAFLATQSLRPYEGAAR